MIDMGQIIHQVMITTGLWCLASLFAGIVLGALLIFFTEP